MSSILKALRKIEEEKRVASHAAPDLRMDQGLASRKAKPFLPLVTGIALGSLCVGFFFFWQSSTTPDLTTQPLTDAKELVVAIKQSQPVTVASQEERVVTPPSVIAPAHQKPLPSVQPSDRIVQESSVSSPEQLIETDVAIKPVVAPEPEMQTNTPVVQKVNAEAPVAVEDVIETSLASQELSKPEAALMKTPALPDGVSLQVTEVFFQEDNANSMAVVNDLPVMVGTYVDSAVVVEIQPESVLFQIGDTMYAIAVSAPQ